MRLLTINFGGLGDEVLFLPTLKSIKSAHPDWELTLLTEPRSRAIKELSKLIDKNIVFDIKKTPLLPGDIFALIKLLREGKYDIVLSSGSSAKVAILLALSGIPCKVGYDSGALSRFLLSKAVPLNKQQYAAYMYHDLVKGLDIEAIPAAPQIDLDASAFSSMTNFLRQVRAKTNTENRRYLVLVHPGTSRLAIQKGIIKTWSSKNWSELIKRFLSMDCEVLLCGGPDDDATVASIIEQLGSLSDNASGLFVNAYGKTKSITELAALMELSDLVVCVDSAPMHIAAALQKRLIALFGPTDPKKLLLESDRVVAITGAEASSESTSATEPCVQIPLDIVYQTAMDQLSRASVQESSLEFHRH
jgi:ADP-heptose:LPS heptosyltransferase